MEIDSDKAGKSIILVVFRRRRKTVKIQYNHGDSQMINRYTLVCTVLLFDSSV